MILLFNDLNNPYNNQIISNENISRSQEHIVHD